MKRLNNLFIILFITIGLLSISYIWNAEANEKILKAETNNQSQEIALLKNKVIELEKLKNEPGNVMGAATIDIGKISGLVVFNNLDSSNTTIVCAQDKLTTKEFCTDELLETDKSNELKYTLEIPEGKYSIYAVTPPDSKKIHYSEAQKCEGDDCNQETPLKVIENETQEDINLYF